MLSNVPDPVSVNKSMSIQGKEGDKESSVVNAGEQAALKSIHDSAGVGKEAGSVPLERDSPPDRKSPMYKSMI